MFLGVKNCDNRWQHRVARDCAVSLHTILLVTERHHFPWRDTTGFRSPSRHQPRPTAVVIVVVVGRCVTSAGTAGASFFGLNSPLATGLRPRWGVGVGGTAREGVGSRGGGEVWVAAVGGTWRGHKDL